VSTTAPDLTSEQYLKGGFTFDAYVRYDRTEGLVPLTMAPVGDRQVVVRTEATQACYTFANWILGDEQKDQAYVPGHGGVGRVVAVGSQVRRFRVGDRALVAITPHCGLCYHCLQGRADMCNFLNNDDVNGSSLPVFAAMEDGRPVTGGRGGFAEYMVFNEEWGTPIFTDLPADQLSLLSCVGSTGLGPPTLTVPVKPGSDVVVFGLGPIGLSMVNGAAIMGAGQVIAIDPVAYRRDVAAQLGATTTIDPTGRDETLVGEIKEMCKGRTDRFHAGGRAWYEQRGTALNPGPPTLNARGPDYIFEAVGGERMTPEVEPSPDPTGILPLQQAFAMCPSYGSLVTTGVGQKGNVVFAAGDFTNKGRTIYSAQYGRTNLMRDTPRYIALMERGLYRSELIATRSFKLAESREAFVASAMRTTVSAHVVFDHR
jgi:S-(hydroxymethyl)glutathione dehydrogenase / alcohol dehydrogenase